MLNKCFRFSGWFGFFVHTDISMPSLVDRFPILKFNREFWLRFLFVTGFLVVAACSNDKEPAIVDVTTVDPVATTTPESLPTIVKTTATVSPTTPTVIPTLKANTDLTPTSTSVVEFDLPVIDLAAARIDQCRFSGDLAQNGSSGHGTAPAPTPTPVSSMVDRPMAIVLAELAVYRFEVGSTVDSAIDLNESFRRAWSSTDTPEKQAAQLYVFGNRLAQLCSAISQPSIPPEVIGEAVGMAESIRARHAWVSLALEEVMCCGDAHTDFLNVGLNPTSLAIEISTSNLGKFLDDRLAGARSDSAREIISDRFGLSISIPSEALLIRNMVDLLVVIIEPTEILNPEDIGPNSKWTDGTALRIRRIRNRSELSAEQAVVEYEGIFSRFGQAEISTGLDIPNVDDIQLTYPLSEESWVGSVSVFVNDGYTYLAEFMCGEANPESCDALRYTIESIQVQ
jgi:hypothetical protein